MWHSIETITDIVQWRLCLGCGACSYICPEQKISLVDIVEEGIRPVLKNTDCSSCSACLQVCPAIENDHTAINQRPGLDQELAPYCGPVMEIWEGHATDPEIRYAGSSGGAITALALYCLEKGGMQGVLHTGASPNDPVRNATRMSRDRTELLRTSGSRYAPAAVCDQLSLIEKAGGPCAFIGQPTEVTALRNAQRLVPALNQNVGLAVSFFCAGSPSTKGTLELLKKLGMESESLSSLRYRGNGWPGHFAMIRTGESKPAHQMTYQDSWAFLQAFRPYATHLCPDGTGEDADISCGDPWYRKVQEGEAGSSLVVARTELGRKIIREAMAAGYLTLTPADGKKLYASQVNLINKRRNIWGRVLAFRLMGLPHPRMKGFSLFRNWRELPLTDKFKSVVGTMRRIVQRGYYRRQKPFIVTPRNSSQ